MDMVFSNNRYEKRKYSSKKRQDGRFLLPMLIKGQVISTCRQVKYMDVEQITLIYVEIMAWMELVLLHEKIVYVKTFKSMEETI